MTLQMQGNQIQICLSQISYRIDLQLFQGLHTGAARHIQFSNGKRPHFLPDLLREQRMYPVRLLKIRSHLCQKLIGRYSDIYRKSKPVLYPVLDLKGAVHRRVIPGCNGGKIHIAFIHAYLLNFRSEGAQIFHQHPALFPVHLMIRRFHHKTRTFTKGIRNRFPCADAISFCGGGFGQHHSMAGLLVAAYNGRYPAQIYCRSFFQFFYRCPA